MPQLIASLRLSTFCEQRLFNFTAPLHLLVQAHGVSHIQIFLSGL